MIDFKICSPDANHFKDVFKFKSSKNLNAEYTDLGDGVGYWIADHPFEEDGFEKFKDLVRCFPIVKDNNHPDNFDPNPFDTIHLPNWVYKDICNIIEDFYIDNYNPKILDPQIHEWGNVYYKHRARPITCWRIPHVDYPEGMVSNLWFTGHDINDSGTKLYKYNGTIENSIYDFQTDENHPMFYEWRKMAENPFRADSWFNMPDNELEKWGFEYKGQAPCIEGKMTMYKANICHSAVISENVDFRWSHAFAFSHVLPPTTFGELLR
jgi:hypothetical protein